MRNRILKKYFLLAAITLILFIFLGLISSSYLNEMLRTRREAYPPIFVAKLIDLLGGADKIKGIQLLEEAQSNGPRPRVVLYNEKGEVIYRSVAPPPPPHPSSRGELPPPRPPDLVQEEVNLSLSSDFLAQFQNDYDFFSREPVDIGPAPKPDSPLRFLRFWGGGPPPMRPPSADVVIRLSGKPIYYIGFVGGPPPMRPPDGMERYLPILGPAILLLSLLLGVGVTISLIYASVRKKVSEADKVISEIQNGNLKARFEVHRKDEFGEAMLRFNKMADEIEALVEHLKFVETARNRILQELAHDLRTPVASLKNLIETLESQNERLEPAVKKELLQLSLREVDYFGQLVEDLLLLARVDEPKYRHENIQIPICDIMDEVLADCLSRPEYKQKQIEVVRNYAAIDAVVSGSWNLLYRMFRNAFENALSFAQSKITIDVAYESGVGLVIHIQDDGQGLTDEQLVSFGERKLSRQITSSEKGKRLSVGLGSVIIKKICEIHRGRVSIKNMRDPSGRVVGAILTIVFESDSIGSYEV
ncbi:HAMP domain-containing sensor histidine kinase [Pseudobdellovibrio exovorus]|uniref:histidine kinase n=1 Tax=Pseudobdellovibrio exovorus JSS TaxID=1184267 RepID=M4V6U7_9BACT|nr:HAMP domain-containing sensor histidine kinase [Pseudobdellovibrio exovorus]AGH94923.1 hypothetical protein A11Q_703 [Pseudobdellovibrio exovorus JSS]